MDHAFGVSTSLSPIGLRGRAFEAGASPAIGEPSASYWRLDDPAEVWPEFSSDGSVRGVPLSGGVWTTAPWSLTRTQTDLPAMSAHVIALCHNGRADSSWSGVDRSARACWAPGVLSIIPAGEAGRWSLTDGVEVSHVYLPDARLQACAAAAGARGRPQLQFRLGVEDPHTTGILELLAGHAVNGTAASRLFAEQCVDLLCMQLIRTHAAPRPSVGTLRRGLADWQLRKVAAYVQARLDEAIALVDLANLVGLSRFHFCTAFRRATGQTPHDWMTGLRMDRAADLLANRAMPITQIALAVGYETPSSFAARFKRRMGLTPSEYRMRLG